eukprot:TRINITY_DN2091_c0_g1_i4.p1 TRINITY_DN2091_c0_g1~~TRINITY_DN2091_c0_g1_i4.p1  ORF type:complete len:820 (+),score=372.39 TRINITY_DN2091_c0_g1_i4:134-2593(+)
MASRVATVALLAMLGLCAAASTRPAPKGQFRPSLIDYNPLPNPEAVVMPSTKTARFTVLTDRLIRMEYSNVGSFEDRATLAVMQRNLPAPAFTQSESGGVLTITTDAVKLTYTVGQPFSSTSLSVTAVAQNTGFTQWTYQPGPAGNVAPDNLLGTIKSLDELGVISLNCTENNSTIVHSEVLHCEWALMSRSGWAIYDDTPNVCLDENDWWSTPLHNTDVADLYGFFHGLDYKGAIYDYQLIGGKTIMVPRYASGVWWSRWFDINNYDLTKIVDDYDSRGLPLDTFVIDMDWHTKDNWSGFTFDTHLFPFPADSMAWLKANGLHITLNLHDASGVNNWDAMFPALVRYLGLPNSTTVVPFNLVNSTVAYAVEDIVLGDLINNKHIDFWWIDWQQGGAMGGLEGYKQNPTIWTDHIRCTDRHRNGDPTRAMVLARWGGMGNHRYQVGFSGDVSELSWANLAFQPYFSWTGSNVLYGFWSHDIEGPATDPELYTRWLQWGAVSGVMRSHDRGMSGGGCANDNPYDCSVVEPWNVPNTNFEAHRLALLTRETLLPYIYNAHRQAFDTGLSIIRPMYYDSPAADMAYAGDENGNYAQYMFGDDILFAPVVSAGTQLGPSGIITEKTVWIPQGVWYDANSGALLTITDDYTAVTKNYALNEIPAYYRGGAVIPFVPLASFASLIGLAMQQYTFLGFKIVPGADSGETVLYEDDGATTGYLAGQYVTTTVQYVKSGSQDVSTTVQDVKSGSQITVTISSNGTYPGFPSSRAYQLRLPNGAPPSAVTVNGQSVAFNRFGAVANKRTVPGASSLGSEAIGSGSKKSL